MINKSHKSKPGIFNGTRILRKGLDNDNNESEKHFQFLMDCMNENLEHARHVEGERMNFIQIHLILVGGVLAILASRALDEKNPLVLFTLIIVTFLGICVALLVDRWNKVFKAHLLCAMNCYKYLRDICASRDSNLYIFDTDLLKINEEYILRDMRKRIPLYSFKFKNTGRTSKIINLFMWGLIIATATVAVVYYYVFWILPSTADKIL